MCKPLTVGGYVDIVTGIAGTGFQKPRSGDKTKVKQSGGQLATTERSLETLTARQRQVWEMTHGLGDYATPMSAGEIAKALGITTNSVYVTRRRVKKLLGIADEPTGLMPKRVFRQESGLQVAQRQLQEQLDGYDQEEESLRGRLQQIEREKPEIAEALKRLRAVTEKTEEREPVAA